MRIGIGIPLRRQDGDCMSTADLMERARATELAGFDGIWIHDNVGRGGTTPDPLMPILVAAAATERVEVGTTILQVPLRGNPVELAQRLLTLHGLTSGRFVAGLGAGSTLADYAASGVDYESRFRLFNEALKTMRALFRGERVGEADLKPWPNTLGGPPILIGTWRSDHWIKRAALEFEGWVTSGGVGGNTYGIIKEGIKKFRDLGGTRAGVASIRLDMSGETAPLADDTAFSLQCPPEEARRRLALLEELGFTDVMLGGEMMANEQLPQVAEELGIKQQSSAAH